MSVAAYGTGPGPCLRSGIVTEHRNERVTLSAEGISPQQVLHAAVFFVVPEVERDAVGPPVIAETLHPDKLLVCGRFELHEFAVVCPAGRRDADALWACVDSRSLDPRSGEMKPAPCIAVHRAGKQIPDDGHVVLVEEVDEE